MRTDSQCGQRKKEKEGAQKGKNKNEKGYKQCPKIKRFKTKLITTID